MNKNDTLLAFINRPLFVANFAAVLGTKLGTSQMPQHDVTVIRKQLIKISKMYLIWSVIYLPLAACGYYMEGKSLPVAIIHYIRGLVLVGEHYNSWQLWYLLSTIYSLIVIALLLRFGVSKRYFPIVSLLAAILSIGLDELVLHSGTLPGLLQLLQKAVSATILNGRIFQGLIYMPIGICIAQRPLSLKVSMPVFILGFAANYLLKNSALSSMLLVITSIAFFGIVLAIQLKEHPIYPTLRSLSTNVYLLHMYVWTGYYLIIYGEKATGIDSFVATTVLSVAFAYVYLFVQKRVRHK